MNNAVIVNYRTSDKVWDIDGWCAKNIGIYKKDWQKDHHGYDPDNDTFQMSWLFEKAEHATMFALKWA